MKIHDRLKELGIRLPVPPEPVANFSNFIIQGNVIYISGQGPVEPGGKRHCGRVGREVPLVEAKKDARLAGINVLAVINDALGGDLEKVEQVLKITGFVNSEKDFFLQPEVINGCSDLLVEVFGERGRHARSAIGVAALPFNISVEVEAVIALKA